MYKGIEMAFNTLQPNLIHCRTRTRRHMKYRTRMTKIETSTLLYMHACSMTHEMHRVSQVSRIVWVKTRSYLISSSAFKVLLSDMPLEVIDTGIDIVPLFGSNRFVGLLEGERIVVVMGLVNLSRRGKAIRP